MDKDVSPKIIPVAVLSFFCSVGLLIWRWGIHHRVQLKDMTIMLVSWLTSLLVVFGIPYLWAHRKRRQLADPRWPNVAQSKAPERTD